MFSRALFFCPPARFFSSAFFHKIFKSWLQFFRCDAENFSAQLHSPEFFDGSAGKFQNNLIYNGPGAFRNAAFSGASARMPGVSLRRRFVSRKESSR
ncbi:MAG: hypothetical protein A2Z83_03470 [Omnitrophica bacterium GWA2_52_8]|nr:MAG: hypothetical protein A2Z83_03470 [Omnitrophica bacterium GWA2_52_8]